MTDVRELIATALTSMTSTVQAVPDERWDAPSPCEDWTVRDVVAHLTREHLWAVRLLAGESVADVGDQLDGEVLGADSVAAWTAAAEASSKAWRGVELDQLVHLSAGPTPAGEYGEEMLTDLAVHRWDVQRGAGLADAVDGAVVTHVLEFVRPRIEDWAASGLFGPPVPTDSEYAHDQLVALLGRTPQQIPG